MNRKQTKRIVDGALMLAMIGVLVVVDRYTAGLFNMFLYMLIPLPLIWYGYQYGKKYLLLLSFCSLAISLFLGLPETIFYVICSGLISFIVTIGIERNINKMAMFLMLIGVTVVANILSFTLLAGLFGYDIIQEMQSVYQFIIKNFKIFNYNQSFDVLLKTVLPLVILFLGVIEAYAFMSVFTIVLRRLDIPFPKQFHLIHMRLPRWYGIIGCFSIIAFSFFINRTTHNEWYYLFSYLNTIAILSFMLQGVAFLGVYLIANGNNRYFVFVVLLLFIPTLNYLLIPFGLLDIFSEKRAEILYNDK